MTVQHIFFTILNRYSIRSRSVCRYRSGAIRRCNSSHMLFLFLLKKKAHFLGNRPGIFIIILSNQRGPSPASVSAAPTTRGPAFRLRDSRNRRAAAPPPPCQCALAALRQVG